MTHEKRISQDQADRMYRTNEVTLTFPFPLDSVQSEQLSAQRDRLFEAARLLGSRSRTWKLSELKMIFHFKSAEAAARFQVEAVPLPPGWIMEIT
jgi:hypothetical protein